ncbi:MAG TPA: ATP-binding protein [Armatimonadota bacterium]|nr:ATP-binding protein [Armatimonadota bacterium]
MLRRLHAKGFKSLVDLEIEFPLLTVLFGPNASGKSNIIEAAQTISRCGTARTLSDAFDQSIRGYPLEAFSFGPDGLAGHLRRGAVEMELDAVVGAQGDDYRYRVCVQAEPGTGDLATKDEYLARLTRQGDPWGRPVIERVENRLRIRRKSKPAHPREEPTGGNHTMLSDLRLAGPEYAAIERCRREFEEWRVYYLDPRVAMRAARPPAGVRDIGALGEDIAPFLHRLRSDEPKRYAAVSRTLRSIIPSVDAVNVDLDERRATLDIQIIQDGCSYSSRVISEGTLRVLALCSICTNPWASGLVAFEEPENGVHPRRLELIAQMLV